MRLTPEAEVGLTALVGAAIAWGAAWVKGKIEERRMRQGEAAVIDAAEVYTILAEHAHAISADRVLLLYTSNGGGIPTAGKPLYATILYEVTTGHNISPIMERFQGVLADAAYVHMVATVAEHGRWLGNPDQMELGFLRTLYEEEGVQESLIIRIGTTPKRFYYLSARWISSVPPSEETLDLHSRSIVARLRPLLGAAP